MSDIITRPIGDIFEYQGKAYQVCVETNRCAGCAFYDIRLNCGDFRHIRGYCDGSRTDKQGEIFKEIKIMKKKDLKAGMIVETVNKKLYLLVSNGRDGLYGLNNEGWLRLLDFSEDLKCIHSESYSINKVYSGQQPVGLQYLNDFKGNLIWDREKEKIELTLGDIANKLGIPVEQLRIKD